MITLPPSGPELAERFALVEGAAGYWTWWESNESVLLTVDADLHTYLLRCSATGVTCQRVADLGTSHPLRQLALTYRAGALLRAVLIWLHALGDTPSRHLIALL